MALIDEQLAQLRKALEESPGGTATPSFERAPLHWLPLLEAEWQEHEANTFKALYWSLYEAFRANGVGGAESSRAAEAAAHKALRATRQAVLLLLARPGRGRLIAKLEQRDVAQALGISTRTATNDIAMVGAVLNDGSVGHAAARPLPPVPVPAGNRVTPRARRPAD